MIFISPERRFAAKPGNGVQYIPGHIDEFVDYINENLVPISNSILDIGGGGLRFAVPVALKHKHITVIDEDPTSLDISFISKQINQVGKLKVNSHDLSKYITPKLGNLFDIIPFDDTEYSLITSFRVIHFMDPVSIVNFFEIVTKRLASKGIIAISAMTPFISNTLNYNELFLNSYNLSKDNELYREFKDTDEAIGIKQNQNLPDTFHMIDENFIRNIADRYNLTTLAANVPSTRIVSGYIMQNKQ